MYKVDLNSDLGESFGAYTIGLDEAGHCSHLLRQCGLRLSRRRPPGDGQDGGCRQGRRRGGGRAPGYPDLMGFGRRNMVCSPRGAKAPQSSISWAL